MRSACRRHLADADGTDRCPAALDAKRTICREHATAQWPGSAPVGANAQAARPTGRSAPVRHRHSGMVRRRCCLPGQDGTGGGSAAVHSHEGLQDARLRTDSHVRGNRWCARRAHRGRGPDQGDDRHHGELDDSKFAVDHFFVKLFKVADSLHTASAREEAAGRVEFMRAYLRRLGDEVGVEFSNGTS